MTVPIGYSLEGSIGAGGSFESGGMLVYVWSMGLT